MMTVMKKISTTAIENRASTNCARVDRATPKYRITATRTNRMIDHHRVLMPSNPNSAIRVSCSVPAIMIRMPPPSARMPT